MSSPHRVGCLSTRLNESPSKKEGKYQREDGGFVLGKLGLNESPSQKEGKSRASQPCT